MIFKCNNCGGIMTFSPELGAMYCEHCDGIDTEGISSSVMGTCGSCGAPIEITDFTSATKCEHCGSYQIFEERITNQYTPHLIIPFKISKQSAKTKLREHFCKNPFLPSDFLSEKQLMSIEGEYVPFWMYDYDANYDFIGEGKKVRSWVSGNTEYVETSVFQIQRNMDINFDLIPVDASAKMPDAIMDLMEPYNYAALERFQAKYMSGFNAETYNFYAAETESRAGEKATRYAKQLMAATYSGYASVTPINDNLILNKNAINFALLPVWHYKYKFKDKLFEYYINGQTGKIFGMPPVSKAKKYGYTLFMFVLLTAIAFLGWAILEVL